VDADEMGVAGSWSAYWYNGLIVSSEIGRGLDILELAPSPYLTQNEIDAARTVQLDYLNAQGQPQFEWPASFALARAHLDQLQRDGGLESGVIREARQGLARAESASGVERGTLLGGLGSRLQREAMGAGDPAKVRVLAETVASLAAGTR
jgi:hypothetical protein